MLEETCGERGARLLFVGEEGPRAEVLACEPRGMRMRIHGRLGTYEMTSPLVGAHQAENAAVAVGLVELLAEAGLPVSGEAIEQGIANVRWPGRFQVVRERPTLILDGAHDEAAAEVLAATLKDLYPNRRLVLVVGVGRDKDAKAIAGHLAPLASTIIATAGATPRALGAEELREVLRSQGREAAVCTPVSEAVRRAMEMAEAEDVVVVTGSLYVVGEGMGLEAGSVS